MPSSSSPLRIVLLDAARSQAARVARLLEIPHEFVEPSNAPQTVDAVVGFRFGRTEAKQYRTRLVHLPGAGADGIDLDALDPGCSLCNAFEHEVPVAEFVIGAILNHAIGFSRLTANFAFDKWSTTYFSRTSHVEVSGKTLGLVGYGHIGKAVAQRARALGMRVHAVSHSGLAPGADWAGDASHLRELLEVADFLVIACPLTEQTRDLIGKVELDAMKPSMVLINIGRAQIVNEAALFHALETQRIAAASLDVWYDYPAPGDLEARPSRFRFDRLPNVHCTPHSSAWTEEMFQRRYRVICDNLRRLYHGEELRNVIHGPTVVPAI